MQCRQCYHFHNGSLSWSWQT